MKERYSVREASTTGIPLIEIRLEFESFEPLVDFLAFMFKSYSLKPKIGNFTKD